MQTFSDEEIKTSLRTEKYPYYTILIFQDRIIQINEWYKAYQNLGGCLHNLTGPAMIWNNSETAWYINGMRWDI